MGNPIKKTGSASTGEPHDPKIYYYPNISVTTKKKKGGISLSDAILKETYKAIVGGGVC
jgi:hypothetical protein